MANINKIRLSGQTYDIQDPNASKTVELTQAQYDALTVKDPNTFYIITDAQGADLSQYYTSAQTESAITQAVSGKVDTSTFNTYSGSVDTALSGKQDTLSAGTGIDITDNVISATGGGGGKSIVGGRGITVTTGETADTVSFNLPLSSSTMGSDSIVGGYFGNKSMAQYGFAYGDNAKCGNGGSASIALGRNVTANGNAAIALGSDNTAKGKSVAIGRYINTNIEGEIGVGIYNVSSSASTTFGDSGNTLFSVGNGTSSSARHNAFEIRQNGDIYISSGGTDIKLQDHLGGGGGGSSYTAGDGIDITNDVISVTGKVDTSAITTSVTSSSTDAQVPSAKAVNDKLGGLSIVKLTESEYAALVTKDSNTLYCVVPDPSN